MKRNVLSCVILVIFIVGQVPRPSWAAAVTTERLADRIAFGGNNCRTECDCYKNSALYGTDTAHLCFECSRERNGTCQVVAACPAQFICTTDPAYGSDTEFTCVHPRDTKTEPECITDSDCVRSFQHPHTLEVKTFSGYCLPNANCRFPKYGVLPGTVVALELSLRPFNHLTCSPRRQNLPCKSLGDCYYHGANNPGVLQDANITCSSDTGLCISETLRTLVLLSDSSVPQQPQPLPAAKTERNRLLQRLNTTANASTHQQSSPPLVPVANEPVVACNVDEDCTHLGRVKDSEGFASCYSCLPTFGSASTPSKFLRAANISRQCVRTDSGCASGMCHHGQCVGKHCKTHSDCLEIAGTVQHCHQCDAELGICRERHLCAAGQFCTADVDNQRYCSALIQECDSTQPVNLKQSVTCVPTGTDGLGYQRLTNYLPEGKPSVSKVPSYQLFYQSRALLMAQEEKHRMKVEAAAELARQNQTTTNEGWIRMNSNRLDSIAFDQMPENINQRLFSRGSNGQARIIQYTPAQQARRTRASFEREGEVDLHSNTEGKGVLSQSTVNSTQSEEGDVDSKPKESHTGDVLGDETDTTTAATSKVSTPKKTVSTSTTPTGSNPDPGQPSQVLLIVTLVVALLLLVAVVITWFIIPSVSRIYIRHYGKSSSSLAELAAESQSSNPSAASSGNNIVIHPSTTPSGNVPHSRKANVDRSSGTKRVGTNYTV